MTAKKQTGGGTAPPSDRALSIRASELTKEVKDRFWAKVNRGERSQCWTWKAGTGQDGYGRFSLMLGGKSQMVRANRIAYAISKGGIGQGLIVLHRCDNEGCVNPGHLYTGKELDNSADMVDHGGKSGKTRKAEGIDIEDSTASEVAKAQSFSSRLATVAPGFVERTLRFVEGPADAIDFLKELPSQAAGFRDTLAQVEVEKADVKIPLAIGAVANDLAESIERIQNGLGEAPDTIKESLSDAHGWLGKLSEVVKELPGAEDRAELVKDDVSTEALEDGGLLVPAQDGGKEEPLAVEAIQPAALAQLSDKALEETDTMLHRFFAKWFVGNERLTYREVRREAVVNAEAFMVAEFRRRGLAHRSDDELAEEAQRFQRTKSDDKQRIKPPWPWAQSMRRFVDKVSELVPSHTTYVEPFAGSARMLFAKEPSGQEILADLDADLMAAFRAVKSLSRGNEAWLRRQNWTGSESLFKKLKASSTRTGQEGLRRFIYLQLFSWAGNGDTFMRDKLDKDRGSYLDRLAPARARLSRVKLKTASFEQTIAKYDSKDTFFVVDPPFERFQSGAGGPSLAADLVKALNGIKGRYLLLYQGSLPGLNSSHRSRVRYRLSIADGVSRGEKQPTHAHVDLHLNYEPVKKRELAPVNEVQGDPIALRDVLGHCKSFKLRMPLVHLVGGLANRGETRNDIDLLIGSRLGELEHVLKIRLGQMFPADLSKRIRFIDDDLSGPMSNHVEIADLVVEMRPEFRVKQMAVAKQNNLLELPIAGKGPRPAVLQAHFRGKSLHLDLRIKANDHLIGWTLMTAKPGAVPDVDTVEDARRIGNTIDTGAGRYSKPFLAPAKVRAEAKSRQSLAWLKIDSERFEPGEIGAGAEEQGVIVAIDRPVAEFGLQKAQSHEYFLSKGKLLNGILYFRRLVGSGGTEEEEEAGRRAGPGEVFWNAWLSKDLLPSVLSRRAVNAGSMPPDGYSAIPQSLEGVTPKEFRYWEAKGAEARKIRDALVESRFFTTENIRLVNNEFRRVTQKMVLFSYAEQAPEPYAKRFRAHLAKQPRKFALSRQCWKGQGAERQAWHLIMDSQNGLETWILSGDPLSESAPIGAVETPRVQKDLLGFSGEAGPGARIGNDILNSTKATPSTIGLEDEGTVEIVDDQRTFKKLRFIGKKMRGTYTLIAEEEGSRFWHLAHEEELVPVHTKKKTTTIRSKKSSRTLLVTVHGRDEARGMTKAWNYHGAVGPVEADDWGQTVTLNKKLYTPIGIAPHSRLDLVSGSVVAVDVHKIGYAEGPPRSLCWQRATVVEETDDEPSTIGEVLELLRDGERAGLIIKRAAQIGKATELLDCLEPVNAVCREAMAEIRKRLEASGEQRLALGIVLEPEVEDSQKDVYSLAEVRRAAERYARDSERLKVMHKGQPVNDQATSLGSYLASRSFDFDGESVKKGTWLMALGVPGDEIWKAMKAGDLTGLSIGGDAVRVAADQAPA